MMPKLSNGAAWEGVYARNHSKGFAGSAPVGASYKNVMEDRESEAGVEGRGRIERGLVAVPGTMAWAIKDSRK